MKYNDQQRIHSANVQAEVYRQCKNFGIECICEYTHGVTTEESGRDVMVIDCVIVDGNDIVCAVEAKNYKKGRIWWRGKQAMNYALLPVPSYRVHRINHVPALLKHIIYWKNVKQMGDRSKEAIVIYGPRKEDYNVITFPFIQEQNKQKLLS